MNISRWEWAGDRWARYAEDIADSGRRNVMFINVWDVSSGRPVTASGQSMHTAAAADARLMGRKREMERCRMLWRSQVDVDGRREHASWSSAYPAASIPAVAAGRLARPDRRQAAAVANRARPSVPAASSGTATDALSSYQRRSCSGRPPYMTARLPNCPAGGFRGAL